MTHVVAVVFANDQHEAGYRIVRLDTGQYAFVWGNIRARVGDTLPQDLIDNSTDEKGITLHKRQIHAEAAYIECALAIAQCNESIGQSMLRLLLCPDKPKASNAYVEDLASWRLSQSRIRLHPEYKHLFDV